MFRSLFISLFVFSMPLAATPAQIILIRHGEKPATGDMLSLKGYERAAALAPFFLGTPELLQYGTPAAIYAQLPKDDDSSIRCIQTVTPLSIQLSLTISKSFTKKQVTELTEEILSNPNYTNKMVLVCYEHKTLVKIAKALGVKPKPDEWPSDVFDWVWIINYNKNGNASFSSLPQKLMYGDSKSVK